MVVAVLLAHCCPTGQILVLGKMSFSPPCLTQQGSQAQSRCLSPVPVAGQRSARSLLLVPCTRPRCSRERVRRCRLGDPLGEQLCSSSVTLKKAREGEVTVTERQGTRWASL